MTFVAGVWHLSEMFLLLMFSVLVIGSVLLGRLLLMWLKGVSRG